MAKDGRIRRDEAVRGVRIMMTTHLALIISILRRGAADRPPRRGGLLRWLTQRTREVVFAPRWPRSVRDLPLNNHLRRDLGLDPLPHDPFRRRP